MGSNAQVIINISVRGRLVFLSFQTFQNVQQSAKLTGRWNLLLWEAVITGLNVLISETVQSFELIMWIYAIGLHDSNKNKDLEMHMI